MPNIVSILQNRALHSPHQPAYLFLEDGVHETAQITYAELDHQARIIANYLHERHLVGQRVLLLYRSGLDFISSFMGCLYAGVIAVPVNCPPLAEFEKSHPLLNSIAEHAEISGILTTQNYIMAAKKCFAAFKSIFIVDSTSLKNNPVLQDQLPAIQDDTVAYLQYTSGSTSTPNAAIIRHKNLNHSLKIMMKAWRYSKKSITLNWAPHTHVYGLTCGILTPLYHGSLAILIPPAVFVQRPILWLQAITRYRVTHSGCPNFGYDFCVRDIGEEELSDINLKTWKVAINGGERVQYETLDRFAKKFSRCGFKLNHFNSAYGMSEVTGAIAVSDYQKIPRCFQLDIEGLKNSEVKLSDDSMTSRQYMSNGLLNIIHFDREIQDHPFENNVVFSLVLSC